MSSGHEFKNALANVHNIYFKASASEKKIIGSSIALGSSGEKWRISVVLLPEGHEPSYFERTLHFSDIQSLVRNLPSDMSNQIRAWS